MKRYQIFISSTYIDLLNERLAVLNALLSSNCIPVGMELFPAASNEQFEYIKRIIDDSDYYVLIIGGRYGSISDDGFSYTEKEFDYAVSKGIPILAFLHESPEDLPAKYTELNPEARIKLDTFRNKVSHKRLIKYWKNTDELARVVITSLQDSYRNNPQLGWIKSDSNVDNTSLLDRMSVLNRENNELKKENSDLLIRLGKVNNDLQMEREAYQKILNEFEFLMESKGVFEASLAKAESEMERLKNRTEINTIIHITGMYVKMNEYNVLYNKKFDFNLTLGELFGLWGPLLSDSPFTYVAKTYMENCIAKFLDKPKPFPQIDDESFLKIKIQCQSEGIIDLLIHEDGWKRKEYIVITEKGKHFLTSNAFLS